MKKIYYEKVGRRYVPVAEYNSDFLDRFPQGNHLVMCYPGGVSRRFNIDPNYAVMIAAGRVAGDAMCEAIRQASEMRPQKTMVTEQQRLAWAKLARAFGDDLATLSIGSARDIAEAGIAAMVKEAAELMTHPAVRDAYEQLQTVCELVKQKS
jgi:hypothetical protein